MDIEKGVFWCIGSCREVEIGSDVGVGFWVGDLEEKDGYSSISCRSYIVVRRVTCAAPSRLHLGG